MSVSHGHLNGLVPHQFLDGANVHPCHHETTNVWRRSCQWKFAIPASDNAALNQPLAPIVLALFVQMGEYMPDAILSHRKARQSLRLKSEQVKSHSLTRKQGGQHDGFDS
jgi:hypothetical protein